MYVVAAALASVALGAWAFRPNAPRGGGANAPIDGTAKRRVEIVRTPEAQTTPAAASQPASGPVTQPVLARRPLPAEFAILERRNLFARGGGRPVMPAAGAGGPEAAFVLRGVADAGDRLIAFVEDKSAKGTVMVNAGDAVARGKVASITFDGFVYEAAGASKTIRVGQDLNGTVVPPTPTSKPAAPPGGAAPGQPGGPGMPQPGPGGPHRGPPPGAAPAVIEQG
jgi:hypothetical protein